MYLSILFSYLMTNLLVAQEVVVNDKLLAQLTRNHAVRQTSTQGFLEVFKKQRELYEEGEKQIVQVIAIHEHIYNNLYNVNSLFRNGKQVKYIYDYLSEISKNANELLRLSVENPQYAIWLKVYYKELLEQMVRLKNQIEQIILKSDRQLLMDAYDRDYLISNIHYRLRSINISILTVNNMIIYGKSRAYIYSVPILGNYINLDKQMVEDILRKYKQIQRKY